MGMFVYSEVTSNDIILSSSMGTFLKRGRILGVVIFISSFSRDFTTSSIVAMISLFGIVLEESEKLRHFARRSVSIRVNFLKDINNRSCNSSLPACCKIVLLRSVLILLLVLSLSVESWCGDSKKKIVNN